VGHRDLVATPYASFKDAFVFICGVRQPGLLLAEACPCEGMTWEPLAPRSRLLEKRHFHYLYVDLQNC
jgi:hypothetical protein